MSIRSTILTQINDIAAQQKKTLTPLSDGTPLLESGLDSLCLAILVAALDDQLNLDPFGEDGTIAMPVTLGGFIKLYEDLDAKAAV
jgi:acyl carrier protein